jgi:thiamine kinase-like enzyme
MNQCEKALQWATQYLTSEKKLTLVNLQKIIETSYSIVHEIKTTQGVVYLKKTPKALFQESKTLAFLSKQGCTNIPEFIAENSELHCFLMTSCGDESLRHLFNGHVDLSKLKLGILNYTKIQRFLENKVQQLLTLGIPDWRVDKFASLYHALIQQEQLLIGDGLQEKEIESLHQLYPTCVTLCESLSKYGLPQTINHCDFHENNMLLDRNTGDVSIIDWGEVVISHPFFSLNGCLWNITYFNELKQSDLAYGKIQSYCIASWLDCYDEKTLREMLNITSKLSGVFAALAYEQMYNATKDQEKTVQQEHPGSIAGCLRTFLNQNTLV